MFCKCFVSVCKCFASVLYVFVSVDAVIKILDGNGVEYVLCTGLLGKAMHRVPCIHNHITF